jgi:hypothetical protein
MENELTERDILQKALGMLQKKTGLTATAEVYPKVPKDAREPDARIRLTLRELEWNFAAGNKKDRHADNLGWNHSQIAQIPRKGTSCCWIHHTTTS